MQETCFLHFNFQIQVHLATDFLFLFLLEHVSTWLCSTIYGYTSFYLTLLWLYYILLDSMVLYHGSILPWLYSTPLDSMLFFHGSTSLYFTLHYSTMAPLDSIWLYVTLEWLYFTLVNSTLLWVYFTVLNSTLHYHDTTSLYLTLR